MIKGMVIFLAMASHSVYAAQTVKVIVDEAKVFEKSQSDSTVIGTVAKNKSISVSNAQTNGYYKTKIPNGAIGWILGTDVLPSNASSTVATIPTPKTRLMLSGGLQTLGFTNFPAAIPTTGAGSSVGGTLEVQFKINDRFYWGARAEYFTSSSQQTVSATKTQTLTFRTIPVMGGIMYFPVNGPRFKLGVGAYVGMSMLTLLTVTQTTATAESKVNFSSSDLCEMANLQTGYSFSKTWAVTGDVGYRMHSAKYPASTQLLTAAFNPSYSGIFMRLGLEYKLN
jgi:uncharacterized protein YgiM (DUF1202 family)